MIRNDSRSAPYYGVTPMRHFSHSFFTSLTSYVYFLESPYIYFFEVVWSFVLGTLSETCENALVRDWWKRTRKRLVETHS